jgi:hypothetical protein
MVGSRRLERGGLEVGHCLGAPVGREHGFDVGGPVGGTPRFFREIVQTLDNAERRKACARRKRQQPAPGREKQGHAVMPHCCQNVSLAADAQSSRFNQPCRYFRRTGWVAAISR